MAVALALAMTLTLMPGGIISPREARAATAAQLATTINDFTPGGTGSLSASSDGNTVTVTGTVSGANTDLTLYIDDGVTVVWQAKYTDATRPIGVYSDLGGGTMKINGGGVIGSAAGGVMALSISSKATVIVETGGKVSSSSNSAAISLSDSASLIVDGGAVEGVSGAISTGGTPSSENIVHIISGTVKNNSSSEYAYTIEVLQNTALMIIGGTISNEDTGNATNVVSAGGTSVVFVSGGSIVTNGIRRASGTHTATGYYTGANSAMFRTSGVGLFTANTNLFKLDNAPRLTRETVGGASYSYSSTTPYFGSVVAALPTGFAATSITVDGIGSNPHTQTPAAGTVTFAGAYNTGASVLTLVAAGTLADGRIPVSFTTATFGVNIVSALITIDTQPAAETNVTQGSISGTLTVAASVALSGSPTYQWYSNGTASTTGGTSLGSTGGANTATLTIPQRLRRRAVRTITTAWSARQAQRASRQT